MFTTFNGKIQLKWPKVCKSYNPLDELALAAEEVSRKQPRQICNAERSGLFELPVGMRDGMHERLTNIEGSNEQGW